MKNLTKQLIKETFISLIDQKPLTQITVKMIVEECGINRNSFYYHYQDLPTLIEEMIREEADEIINHIYNSVNRDIFEQYLWKVCDHIVESYGQTLIKGRKIDEFDKEIIHLFYKSECFGLVINWLDRKMEPDVHKLISRFCELHRGVIEGMIDRSING